MQTKTQKLVQDITKGNMISAHVVAPFDEGLSILQKNNYSLIYLEENAQLRMQEGAQATISQYGNWVSEDVLYIPKKGIFLTKNSPINDDVKKATQAHRNNKDFYLTKDQVEHSLANAVKLNGELIPTNRFDENEITKYVFGKHAENYGNFLRENGITEMSIWLADMQDKPYARKLWFGWLGVDRSDLDGVNWVLCSGSNGVRGVRTNVGEAAQKIFEVHQAGIPGAQKTAEVKNIYTPEEVNNHLTLVQSVREGNEPNSRLEEIIEFLEKLKQ